MSTPVERLRTRISEKGPIPFADFMQEALYGEDGYYRRRSSPIGIDGDFVTGSSYSPLFAQATARLVRRLDRALGKPAQVLEVGYGDGRHLADLQRALRQGPRRRVVGVDRAMRPLPAGIETLEGLEALSERSVVGIAFSYELFDALPVHRLIGRANGGLGELWVELDSADRFRYLEGELSDTQLVGCLENRDLEPGQIADISLEWWPLYEQLSRRLERGLLVTCDYGYERSRLFDPRVRFYGTLACYRNQRVHRDALRDVGRQDLTAHVDFTTLRRAGEAAGLETIALTRQARWLLACGIFDDLAAAPPKTRAEAFELLDGAGMGDEIRVLVQARDVESSLLFDLHLLK